MFRQAYWYRWSAVRVDMVTSCWKWQLRFGSQEGTTTYRYNTNMFKFVGILLVVLFSVTTLALPSQSTNSQTACSVRLHTSHIAAFTRDLRIMSCHIEPRCTFELPTAGTWFGAVISFFSLVWSVVLAKWPLVLGLHLPPPPPADPSPLLANIVDNTEPVKQWVRDAQQRREELEALRLKVETLLSTPSPLGEGRVQTIPSLLISLTEACERPHRETMSRLEDGSSAIRALAESQNRLADALANDRTNLRSRRLTTLSRRKVRPRRRPDVGTDPGNTQSIPGV